MAARSSRFSPLRLVLSPLLVALIAAGAFGWYLYRSSVTVGDHMRKAQESYDQCMEQVDSRHYEAALSSLKAAAEEVTLSRRSLEGWQWDLADRLPVLSDEVRCARDTTAVADDLINQALMPVLVRAEEIWGDASSGELITNLPSVLGKVSELLQVVGSSRETVSDCRMRADSLGTSHFDGVNNLVATVRDATVQADEAFASFDPLLQAIHSLGDLANGITSAFAAPGLSDTAAA